MCCFSLLPSTGRLDQAGTAPISSVLLTSLSPSCSLAALPCKSFWRAFKQRNFSFAGSNRALVIPHPLFFTEGVKTGLESIHKYVSAVGMLHMYTSQVRGERLMKKLECYHVGQLLNRFPY